jgi:hypothetical protein
MSRADPFRLTLRLGSTVERERFASLADTLDALEERLGELGRSARRESVDLRHRRIEPVEQVAARGEIAGPRGLRGGIDVRGDGSTEAFTGRIRRRLVAQGPDETAYQALRRVLETG